LGQRLLPHTILQLCTAESDNSQLLAEISKAGGTGYRTLLCYLSGGKNDENEIHGVVADTILLGLNKSQVKWKRLGTLRAVARVIDDNNVDLLVCQYRRAISIGILAARLSRRKPQVVGVLHGIVGGKIGVARKLFNFLFYRLMACLVSVSSSQVDDILAMNWRLDKNKIRVIDNGIDFTPYISAQRRDKAEVLGEQYRDTFVFGTVGRLREVKNHDRMIRAFARAGRDQPHWRLVIAGKGPRKEALEALVRNLGLESKVELLGFHDDIPTLLQAIDVYVMPSLREGFGLALLEAMASGLPVITSNCSGMKDIVANTPCGQLVDPTDTDDLATAFQRMATSSAAQLAEMGEAARQRALENFSAARMIRDYEELYREILTGHG